jgi:hypothetical protein
MVWQNGSEEWYRNGKLHREDGPAIVFPDGYRAWYQHGRHVDPPPSVST